MITVNKDAIMFKDSDGNMKSAGVLCKVGTFGQNLVKMMTQWNSVFYQARFTEETHLVLEYGDSFTGEMTRMFAYTSNSNIKSIKIVGNHTVDATLNSAFQVCSVEVIDLSECKLSCKSGMALQYTFQSCSKLKEIKGVIDFSQVASFVGTFVGCDVLEEVRFLQGNIFKTISFANSSKLSDASIQSIIDGLADLTGSAAQTLTLHATVKEKLTEQQISTITSKNWTLA